MMMRKKKLTKVVFCNYVIAGRSCRIREMDCVVDVCGQSFKHVTKL